MKRLTIILLCVISVVSNSTAAVYYSYNAHDLSKLRVFLSQPSAVPSKTNGEQLGLTKEDMSTWEVNEDWTRKLTGISWSYHRQYDGGDTWDTDGRLRSMSWENKSLSGVLDLSGCTSLESYVYVHSNQLTSVNVSGCTLLTTLFCRDNQLTSLDVSGCTSLTKLNCVRNQLTSLNVSGCTSLTELSCGYNSRLSSLDVSGCSSLAVLECGSYLDYGSRLSTLDVSNCTSLSSLSCAYNRLTSLDLSHNLSLTELNCSGNPLMTLDVSHNVSLSSLTCYGIFLTTLDISHNANLTDLDCGGNQLISLDVSHNALLRSLNCRNDPSLRSLEVRSNALLTTLDCQSCSHLISLDVSGCPELESLDCKYTSLTTLDLRNNLWLNMVHSAGCPLTDIYVGWESPILGIAAATTFLSNFHSTTAVLHVPFGTAEAYRSTVSWRDFVTIVESSPPVPPPVVDPPVPPVDPAPVDPSPIDPPVDPLAPEVPSSTIDLPSSSISLSLFNSLLLVTSPSSESITLHSLSGSLLLHASKEKGSTSIAVSHLPRGVLLVHGSSGWTRKIIRQ